MPEDYERFMTAKRPMSGELSIDPGWFELWPRNKLEELNRAYSIEENALGFVGFGSNGGGEFLAFDAGGKVFMIPFIPMDPKEAVKISESWADFEKAMAK